MNYIKKIVPGILAILFFALSSPGVSSQDFTLEVEDILQKHYKAIGLDRKKKIKSLISFGKLNQLGTDLQISIIQKRPSFYRMDVHMDEGRISQAFDGREGWALNPFISGDTIEIKGPELIQLAESADFDGVLVNYKKLGYSPGYDASGVYNGRPVYILKLTKEDGNSLRFYLDEESLLILKTEAEYNIGGMPLRAISEFSDYRKVSGAYFPYKITNRNGQMMTEMRIDTIRINERLDSKLFR